MENKIDQICGIERDPDSDAFGELVCPVVFLWDCPHVSEKRGVVGVIGHGGKVTVIQSVLSQGRPMFLVQPHVKMRVPMKGPLGKLGFRKKETVQGWLSALLLRDAGLRAIGR